MIKTKAIQFNQAKFKFFVISMKSDKLFDISFISRRKEDKEMGFQRLLNESRARLITKYYENGGSIPSPIIASLKSNIDYSFYDGDLSFEDQEETLMILDGQHRLYGMNKLVDPIDVPVVIFVDLKLDEEAKLFIDINTNQRGVPSALLLDIKSVAKTLTSVEERQAKLFDFLNLNGPLKRKLLSDSSRAGFISRPALYEATESIYTNGILSDESDVIIEKAILNYLVAFEEVLRDVNDPNVTLVRTTIFKSALGVFDDVVNKTLSIKNNASADSFYEIIQLFSNIEYNKFSGTNKQTQQKLQTEMRKYLHKGTLANITFGDVFE